MSNGQPYQYHDYHNFESLRANRALFTGLIEGYREIFNAPDPWGEDYSAEDVVDALKKQLSGCATIRLCVDPETGEVAGFCWAQLLLPGQVYRTVSDIQYFHRTSGGSREADIQNLITGEPVIFVQDLGIRKAYRGRVSLRRLIIPVLDSVVRKAGTRKTFYWSIAESRIWKLARRMDMTPQLEHENLQFFCGQLPAFKNGPGNPVSVVSEQSVVGLGGPPVIRHRNLNLPASIRIRGFR